MEEPLLKAFITIAGSVAVIGLLFFLIKKYVAKTQTDNSPVNLKVISRVSLQAKSHVYVVEAGEKTLLIGVAEKNICTLADLTEEKTKSSIGGKVAVPRKKVEDQPEIEAKTNVNIPDASALSFGSFLKSAIKR